MHLLCDPAKCTGCMACYNACAFHAIDIAADPTGKLIPSVNELLCRNCNACNTVCPTVNPPPCNSPISAYALYTKDAHDRSTCSSGGLISGLCKSMLRSGGIVFSVSYNKSGKPEYAMRTTAEEIEEAKGSKYVYAYPDLIYTSVKNALDSGKQCLFVGPPCFVAGLNSFLRKTDRSNLITVDFVCHGVAPFRYLEEDLKQLGIHSHAAVNFRGKHDYCLEVCNSAGESIYLADYQLDPYFLSLMIGITVQDNCATCQYAVRERVSDITAGDFWGLSPDAFPEYGGKVSLALTNTEKGKSYLLQNVSLFEMKMRSVDEAVNGNRRLQGSVSPHPEREKFIAEYQATQDLYSSLKKTSVFREIKKYKIRRAIKSFRPVQRLLKRRRI